MPPPARKPDFLHHGVFLTVKEVTRRWNTSTPTVRRLIRQGELGFRLHWHTYFVPEEEVLMFERKHPELFVEPKRG